MKPQHIDKSEQAVRITKDSSAPHLDDIKVVDLNEIIAMVMSRLPWIIAATLLTTALAAVYAFKAQPQFQAESTLQIALSDRNFANVQSAEELSLTRDDILNTLVSTMKNPEVFEKVSRRLDLVSNKDFHGLSETNSISQVRINGILNGAIKVRLRRGTRLVDVISEHHNRQLAVSLANEFASSFVEYNGERKSLLAQTANKGLLMESERLQQKVKTSEEELQKYIENELDINIVEQRALINSKLSSLNAEFNASLAKVQKLEDDLAKVRELLAKEQLDLLLEVPTIRQDKAVQQAREKYLEQQSALEGLNDRYGEKHPIILNAKAKLTEYKLTLDSLLKSSPLWVESALDTEKFKMETTQKSIKLANEELIEVDGKAIGYNALKRQIESDRAVYDNVLTRLKEMDVAKELDREIVTVEGKALDASQVWPKTGLIIAGGAISGLTLSIGLVLGIGFLDHSLKTVDQAEQFLQLPALGAIPVKQKGSREEKTGEAGERQVMINEPNSTCSESIRTMRATINMLGRANERQVILFTSAIPGEGKSFCCTNYSISLAQQGEKTLLIDLDLRRPSIGKEFNIDSKTPGVSNYLLEDTPLEKLVAHRLDGKLHVLPAGPKLPNPAEQLAGSHIAKLIEEARKNYDRVILDTAPLNAVSDTMSLLKYAQALCLVVRAAKTHRKAVERPLEIMRRAGYPPSGFILNFLPERPGYGSYYYYYYYHGDEYRKGVYGSEEDDEKKK